MKKKVVMIDGLRLELKKVAENGDLVLYRMPLDERICGAPIMDIKEKFPKYKFKKLETLFNSFLFEENGTLILYGPDGEVADQFEMVTDEEINKI